MENGKEIEKEKKPKNWMKTGAKVLYPFVLMLFGAIIALMFIQPVPKWYEDKCLEIDKNLSIAISSYNNLIDYQQRTTQAYLDISNLSITYITKDHEKGMALCKRYNMSYYPTPTLGELACSDEAQNLHITNMSEVR